MRHAPLRLAAVLLLVWTPTLGAQTKAPAADSVSPPPPLFTTGDAYLAAGFVAATALLAPFDQPIARRLQDPRLQENRFLAGAADAFRVLGLPGTLLIGGSLYAAGRIGDLRTTADLGLHTTEALVIALALTGATKGLFGRVRPAAPGAEPGDFELGRGFLEGDDFRSLPSAHTAAAFAAAAALSAEASRLAPGPARYLTPLGYACATLVGLSRTYDHRHWATDVAVGAALGTFSGLKTVRYHHSHPGNRIDRWLLSAVILPDARGGVAVAWSVPIR